MVVKKNNAYAANNFGYLYQNITKQNYTLVEKYYLMAIDHDDSDALKIYIIFINMVAQLIEINYWNYTINLFQWTILLGTN